MDHTKGPIYVLDAREWRGGKHGSVGPFCGLSSLNPLKHLEIIMR